MKLALVISAMLVIAASREATGEEVLPQAPLRVSPLVSMMASKRSDEPLVRHKRFSCDLLSIGAGRVSGFNHAACAAKCLAHRHFGGHCDGPNCKCVTRKW